MSRSNRVLTLACILLFFIGAVALYLYQRHPAKTVSHPNSYQWLNRVEQQASQLSMPPMHPKNLLDWQKIMNTTAKRHNLSITVHSGTLQQSEIQIAAAPGDRVISALAELYAQGLRFQSIRLFEGKPGQIRAEFIRLTIKPERN